MKRTVLVVVLWASTAAWAQDAESSAATASSNRAASLDEGDASVADFSSAPAASEADPSPSHETQDDDAGHEAAAGAAASQTSIKTKPLVNPVKSTRASKLGQVGQTSARSRELPWYRGAVFSLALVLAAIAALALLLRRLLPSFRPGGVGLVEVVGRTHLSPKQTLNLVRVGRRLVLVGATSERLNALCQIDDPREVMEILARVPGSSTLGSVGFEEALTEATRSFEEEDLEAGEVAQMPSAARLDEAKGRVQGLLARLKTMQRQVDEP